jgi:hypothetical protein
MSDYIVCVNCFQNEGVRIHAASLGLTQSEPCPNCGVTGKPQLDVDALRQLFDDFFIRGTVPLGMGGYAPILAGTPNKEMESVKFDETLQPDYQFISAKLGLYLFHYAPPLWRLGYTDHYDCFDPPYGHMECLEHILSRCARWTLKAGTSVYRIRLNPSDVRHPTAFDTPLRQMKRDFYRFDEEALPVFYGALDIETCLHECRTSLEDWVTLATFEVVRDLPLVDLIDGFDESKASTPFQALSPLFNALTSGGKDEYPRARVWARFLRANEVAGFRYASYFSQVKSASLSDIALFGYPVADGLLHLKSLNRVKLEAVHYEYILGPVDTQPSEGI